MMFDSVAGVALAAGAGSRLAPITDTVAKPLCPVATRTLLDVALERLAAVGCEPAVNIHHHEAQLRAAVGRRAYVSLEPERPLGTAGALGNLRDWIAGRPTLVVNADTWCEGGLAALVDGWDGVTVRVLVPGGGRFGPRSAIVGSLLPWRVVGGLEPVPSGLYEVVWKDEHDAGNLEVVAFGGRWMDCGTPARLLEANLAALGDRSLVHPDATVTGAVVRSAISERAIVAGSVTDSVVFAGAVVARGETLRRVIRWPGRLGDESIQL